MKKSNMEKRSAFTLVELLVVISIIAMLLSILMPALSRARKQAHSVVCLNQIKQMLLAAAVYTESNKNLFPLAYKTTSIDGIGVTDYWDYMGSNPVRPGLLWQGTGNPKIQQCPSFKGTSNMTVGKYSGYNYNSSYVGGVDLLYTAGSAVINHIIGQSASTLNIKKNSACAVFGEGRFISGANHLMRSPFSGPIDKITSFSGSYAGTQDFRHLGKTNIGWADGSVSSQKTIYNPLKATLARKVAVGTGFLSTDNSAYDLN